MPSALAASIRTAVAPGPGLVTVACTSSPSTTMVWKWALRQPCETQRPPHRAPSSGSNWLKWVGPSMGAPANPRFAAVSASWTLVWPAYDCSASIWRGARSGPVRMVGVSEVGLGTTGL